MRAGHNRNGSRQDYVTPWPFILAVEKRFGKLSIDLAATKRNRRCDKYLSRRQNSLAQPWETLGCNLWLNPPYKIIEPWVRKAAETRLYPTSRILILVPASIGTNWFQNWVFGRADIYSIGRLKFSNEREQCNRDMMLLSYEGHRLYEFAHRRNLRIPAPAPGNRVHPGFYLWDWREDDIKSIKETFYAI